jgi:hypothetical protein
MYRGKLMTSINNMRKINDKKRDIINKYKDKPTKESVDTKLNIYEACEKGYITESEKNDLIILLESDEDDDLETSQKDKKNNKKIIRLCIKAGLFATALIVAIRLMNKNAVGKFEFAQYEDDLNDIKDEIRELRNKLDTKGKGSPSDNTHINRICDKLCDISNDIYRNHNLNSTQREILQRRRRSLESERFALYGKL